MDAEEAPGAREAPECTREAHQLRRETEGGLAAASPASQQCTRGAKVQA